jgi:hypothetical protein
LVGIGSLHFTVRKMYLMYGRLHLHQFHDSGYGMHGFISMLLYPLINGFTLLFPLDYRKR